MTAYDAVADIVAERVLTTLSAGAFAGLGLDARLHKLTTALRGPAGRGQRAGQYELGGLGTDLVTKILELASPVVVPELAQAAAATAITEIGLDTCWATVARVHHAAWGRTLSARDEDLDLILADLRRRVSPRVC